MKKQHSYSVDTVFVLTLFCVFAVTILFVLMSGANVYKDNAKIMHERYEERTCLSYISSKIRHYDSKDAVKLINFDGVKALSLEEEIDGTKYNTLIYYYNGHVKELFCEKGTDLSIDSGTDIIDVKDLNFKRVGKNSNLIEIKCTGNSGGSSSLIIGTESENGGALNE